MISFLTGACLTCHQVLPVMKTLVSQRHIFSALQNWYIRKHNQCLTENLLLSLKAIPFHPVYHRHGEQFILSPLWKPLYAKNNLTPSQFCQYLLPQFICSAVRSGLQTVISLHMWGTSVFLSTLLTLAVFA